MTKQIPDVVLYKGQKFILAGLKGTGLLTPRDFGISPEMMGVATACYRGYSCKYNCVENELFFVELGVIHRDKVKLPLIEDVSAKSDSFPLFHNYENLRIPCRLSGGLVLVRNSVGPVGHFPSRIEFEEVIEVIFEQGMLQREIDHSLRVADLRKTINELSETLEFTSPSYTSMI